MIIELIQHPFGRRNFFFAMPNLFWLGRPPLKWFSQLRLLGIVSLLDETILEVA